MQHTYRLLSTLLLGLGTLTAAAQWNSDSTEMDSYGRYRVGGYGEMVASRKDYGTNRFVGTSTGNTAMHRATIALPRFVIAGDYRFNRHFMLGAEIEFEAGGTGSAYEIENTENGEYETEVERGGEVALEQFHLTYHHSNAFNLRVGHMVVPVGLTNAHHEPILFFGTTRPEGETTLVPSTWHETGVQLFGQMGRRWASCDYTLMVVAGLNANGMDRNHWAGRASQGLFEVDNLTSPAYVARLQYRGVPGLRFGASLYYCHDLGSNGDKPHTYNFGIPLCIWNVDAQYQCRWLTARANYMQGYLGNSSRLSAKNAMLSNLSPYTRTSPIAQSAITCGAEAGLRLQGLVRNGRMPDLVPFARYEYYNPQQRVITDAYSSSPADRRLQTSMWIAGINYRPLPMLVVKADYTHRTIGGGNYRSENELAVGIAYTAWFSKKK